MATFQDHPNTFQLLDLAIFQNGWTSSYWKTEVLANDIAWFRAENYAIVDFDCTTWINESIIHPQLRQKLNFPDFYGANLNALNDRLSELQVKEPTLVIAFRSIDSIDKSAAQGLLDIFANNSRRHILFGIRMIVLAQVPNALIEFGPIGG